MADKATVASVKRRVHKLWQVLLSQALARLEGCSNTVEVPSIIRAQDAFSKGRLSKGQVAMHISDDLAAQVFSELSVVHAVKA
eukprot:3940716-Rhodomonas_salina.2